MKKAIILIFLVTSLSLTQLVQAANEGSAQAEVLDATITTNIVQNINFGRFYYTIDSSNNTTLTFRNDGSVIPTSNINFRGGQQKGIIEISTHSDASVTISTPSKGVFLNNADTKNAMVYVPTYLEESVGGAQEGKPILSTQVDSQGKLRVSVLGQLLVAKSTNLTPGAYNGTFEIAVDHQ